jgi:hypothetical protein
MTARGWEYSNTPPTDTFLDKHNSSYIGGMLEMANQPGLRDDSHRDDSETFGQQRFRYPERIEPGP